MEQGELGELSQVLKCGKEKYFFAMLFFLAIFLAGVFQHDKMGSGDWVMAVGSAPFVIGGLTVCLRQDMDLMIYEYGFAYAFAFSKKKKRFRWDQAVFFNVWDFVVGQRVLFDLSDSYERSAFERFNERFCGFAAGFPDNYGMSADQLANLMNAKRAEAVRAPDNELV